jgi:hypothetical protein
MDDRPPTRVFTAVELPNKCLEGLIVRSVRARKVEVALSKTLTGWDRLLLHRLRQMYVTIFYLGPSVMTANLAANS